MMHPYPSLLLVFAKVVLEEVPAAPDKVDIHKQQLD